jgi:hypothetical protein
VGFVRSAYERSCRWYVDGPVGRISYYFVPPTNKYLKGVMKFFPYSQYEPDLYNVDDPGEITTSPRFYSKGNNPNPLNLGDSPCGDVSDFAGESLTPAAARRTCDCMSGSNFIFWVRLRSAHAPGLGEQGALRFWISLLSISVPVPPWIAQGGERMDGTATQVKPFAARGGERMNGVSLQGKGLLASGGERMTGAARFWDFPYYLLHDRFIDADAVRLHDHMMNVGPGWIENWGQWQINADQGQMFSGVYAQDYVTSNAGRHEVTCVCSISLTGVALNGGLALRLSANQSALSVILRFGAQDAILIENNAGSESVLASGPASFVKDVFYRLRVICSGQTLSTYLSGVNAFHAAGVAFNQTATNFGLSTTYNSENANTFWDNFYVVENNGEGFGGAAAWSGAFVSSGGEAMDGSAAFPTAWLAAGGEAMAGDSFYPPAWLAAGGEAMAGDSFYPPAWLAAGGEAMAGDSFYPPAWLAAGGEAMDGNSRFIAPFRGDDGEAMDGDSLFPDYQLGDGGEAMDGDSLFPDYQLGDGGEAMDGNAIFNPPVFLSDGGEAMDGEALQFDDPPHGTGKLVGYGGEAMDGEADFT